MVQLMSLSFGFQINNAPARDIHGCLLWYSIYYHDVFAVLSKLIQDGRMEFAWDRAFYLHYCMAAQSPVTTATEAPSRQKYL